MTLREELLNTANDVRNRKGIDDKHKKAVYDYLSQQCKSSAQNGHDNTKIPLFSGGVRPTKLSDGTNLTESDIESFASEQNLRISSDKHADDWHGCYIT